LGTVIRVCVLLLLLYYLVGDYLVKRAPAASF